MLKLEEIKVGMSYKSLIDNFLNEDKLSEYLKLFFPNNTFIRDTTYPGHKFRPDFRCDDLKLIVEFDGDRHYTKSKVILNDEMKKEILCKDGYKVIRIPNFIQMSTEVIKLLFNIDYEFEQVFPHGFISKEVTLPADFCELGIDRFIKDLETFQICNKDIIESLKVRIDICKDTKEVLPNKLNYILDDFTKYMDRESILYPYLIDEDWSGGIREFDNLKKDTLLSLIEGKFVDINLFEGEETPNIFDLIDFLDDWENIFDISVFGYEVSKDRPDCRITISGIVCNKISKIEKYKNGEALITEFENDGSGWKYGFFDFPENREFEKDWDYIGRYMMYDPETKTYFSKFNP